MILLFTDFGLRGPYVGQMHAVFARHDTMPAVIDLMHDAPSFRPRAAGHLLDALVRYMAPGAVCVGVIDPGVGGDRPPVVLQADGRWFVGPGNDLFDVVAARAGARRWWRITREPEGSAETFHGRDLFAPVAAALACGEPVPGEPFEPDLEPSAADDLAAVIYVDGFGNAMTGLRPPEHERALRVAGRSLRRVRIFAEAPEGEPVWLVNSIGLVEIAVNRGSAANTLGLQPGDAVDWAP